MDVDNVAKISSVCCGQAYIFLFPDGNNSIVISGGANMAWNAASPLSLEQIEAIKQSMR